MDLNFEFFYTWVKQYFKIDLSAYKEKQLQRRIASVMKNTGAKSLEEYSQLLKKDPVARQIFLDYITINVTEFYRNPEIFDEFTAILMKEIIGKYSQVKIWSAACSIGAEPYSLALFLAQQPHTSTVKILATDIDETILKKAKVATYKSNEVKHVPEEELRRYFIEVGDGYQLSPQIKKMIQFQKHDLLLDDYSSQNHVVICRNVTIYFKNEARDEIYRKISESLVSGGLLFVGATETINHPKSLGFKKLTTFIYQKI